MRSMKKFSVLAIAVFALSVIGVANASAAQFTASATGELAGSQLENQVFTINAGALTCKKAATTGTIVATASPEQEVTVVYSECTGPLGVPVDNVHATYLFTANGTVHIKATITITVTSPFGTCTVTVPEGQTVGTVAYATNGSNIKVTPSVTGITYTTSGGSCGSGGSNGTYKGANEVHRVGGGTLSFDP